MNVTIELIGTSGFPITLSVSKDDDRQDIIDTLERADKIASYFAAKGWGFAAQPAALPSAAELDRGPTFCGYRCSSTVDESGLPTWVVVDGQTAMRRSKQGDHWYSIKLHDGTYEQVLRIPKGEKVAVKGI
jgi:hypothetical protein